MVVVGGVVGAVDLGLADAVSMVAVVLGSV